MGGYASFVIITVARLLATFSAEGTIQINFSQNLCNLNIALKEGCKKEAFLLGEGGGGGSVEMSKPTKLFMA